MTVATILLVIACLLWLLAAIGWPQSAPIQLGWLGAFFFGLAQLVGHL